MRDQRKQIHRSAAEGRGPSLADRLLNQLRQFLIMFFYLWILFALFVLNEMVILKQHGLNVGMNGFALLNAFVLAKVMLVVEELNLARWLHKWPLVYPIAFESALLAVLFIFVHTLEHAIVGAIKGESLQASVPALGGGGPIGLLAVALILFVSLIPFFAFKNLSRVLGVDYVISLLFRWPQRRPASDRARGAERG
jgi:hypothetical protein